jgi:hypothetical protein
VGVVQKSPGGLCQGAQKSKQTKELISRIEQAASELEFSGVISVFRDASIVFSKAFGYRDIEPTPLAQKMRRGSRSCPVELEEYPPMPMLVPD